MTQFDKEKFHYHGGYLMYHGTYEGQPSYEEVYGKDKIHPSRIGMPVELFIARFKYVFFQGVKHTVPKLMWSAPASI